MSPSCWLITRRLRNLEGGEGEQDQRQLLVKTRAASNRRGLAACNLDVMGCLETF